MNDLNLGFIKRMDEELKANANKGTWEEWEPNDEDYLSELYHHVEKLKLAMITKNYEEVKEFSADVANLAEKAFTLAEKKEA